MNIHISGLAPSLPTEKVTTQPYLVPLMSPRERLVFCGLVALWLAALAQFWWWWLQPAHNIGWFRFLINSLLVLWTTAVPAYFFTLFARSRVANPALDPPQHWRVAMVVTKAPSEGPDLLKKTLLAMLAQPYPHDTWLADEDPTPEMLDWCRRHGVAISSRRGIAAYHQAGWPRRTKCKEGNLAYFYDTYGYDNYDFVVQLDADHVPAEGYLEAMLRPFLDPAVGYVSAPSICDSNAHKSWAARGRLQFEASLHGAMQAGYSGGFAPLCIGSHYAVRTTALRQVGGLGPELAEDHSTTLILNSGGWRGVHAIDAEAHGDGPNTFSDMVVQEFQWSRSLITILLRYTAKYIGALPGGMRFQFLFCQFWYLFYSVSLLATVALPIVALLSGQAWVGISYLDFFVRMTLLTATLLLVLFWLRNRGWMRPSTKVLSWEGVLFIFARWPWTLLGVAVAVMDVLRAKESGFKVTPKGLGKAAALPFRVLAPYLGLAFLSGLTAVLVSNPGGAPGFYAFALANCLLYLTITAVVVFRHGSEQRRAGGAAASHCLHPVLRTLAFGAASAVLVVGAALRLPAAIEGVLWGSSLILVPRPAISQTVGGPDTIQLGVYDWNGTFAGEDYIAIDHTFISWLDGNSAGLQSLAAYSRERNRWPMVTIEPWSDGREGSSSLLQAVNAGRYDVEIGRACARLAAMDLTVFVRWGHEMEVVTGRYPWADENAAAYVAAYRRFVDACRKQDAKFFFVWSPRGDGARLGHYYPGPDYVDQIGLSLYSYAAFELENHGRVRALAEVLAERYERIRKYDKTTMIAELGVDGPLEHRRRWLADGLAALGEFPLVRSLVYFNAPDSPEAWGKDWPVPDWGVDPRVFTTETD